MENESGSPLFIIILIVLFIVIKGVLGGRKDKKTMLRGTPYLGLKIEWPAYCTGTITIENGPTLNFPNDLTNENILYSRQKKHEQKFAYLFHDQSMLSEDSLSFSVEYTAENAPQQAELDIELAIFFVESKEKFVSRELDEFETNVNGSAKNDITFSNLQQKLARYKKIYQQQENQPYKNDSNDNDNNTVQR